eukprot:2313513-Rhodomonas_salina.1
MLLSKKNEQGRSRGQRIQGRSYTLQIPSPRARRGGKRDAAQAGMEGVHGGEGKNFEQASEGGPTPKSTRQFLCTFG